MSAPFLSIIIPARNEEARLTRTLEQVFAYLQERTWSAEVLVVDNASTDGTYKVAEAFCSNHPSLRVLREPEPGKGNAVRCGLFAALGEYRFIADADLSMPISEVERFLPPACSSDIAIASREAPGAVRYNEPYYRHFTGRVFNLLIRTLLLPGLQDTQCGFKCFRAAVAADVFRYQTLPGWAFDVEILYIATRRGYSIREVGIPWYYHGGSKISVLGDSGRMFLDLLRIRRNARQGKYEA